VKGCEGTPVSTSEPYPPNRNGGPLMTQAVLATLGVPWHPTRPRSCHRHPLAWPLPLFGLAPSCTRNQAHGLCYCIGTLAVTFPPAFSSSFATKKTREQVAHLFLSTLVSEDVIVLKILEQLCFLLVAKYCCVGHPHPFLAVWDAEDNKTGAYQKDR
jgi:hypothetical protein